MGSSLEPVLAKIIMTELEEVVIKPLIANRTIMFYTRFVDFSLLVIKPDNVKEVHNSLSKFDKNLHFTINMIHNKVPQFLDLELSPNGIAMFGKHTNTGLYVNFKKLVPWTYRKSWTKTLVTRSSRVQAPNKFSSEINIIKRFASWNDFAKLAVNSVSNKNLKTSPNNEGPNINTTEKSNEITIYFRFPYHADKGLHYSNLAFVKSNLIAKNIIQLYLDCYMMSPKQSFFATPKTELQSKMGILLCMIFFVLDVMPTVLAEVKELYMKDLQNMPGMTKIALCLTILMNVQVFSIGLKLLN